MIIKVPLRISFIGGGTDIAPAFLETPGLTISATFDKYVYIGNQDIVPDVKVFNDIKNNLTQFYNNIPHFNELQPQVCILFKTPLNWPRLNIASEIVPGSGLGTSSALSLGLMFWLYQNLYNINNSNITPKKGKPSLNELAQLAVFFERYYCGIPGGVQDQFIAAYPGLTKLEISGKTINSKQFISEYNNINLNVNVIPFHSHDIDINELSKHLLLVDTGIIRRQKSIMTQQINDTENKSLTKPLKRINSLTKWFEHYLKTSQWYELGKTLTESWEEKKQLNKNINLTKVDLILEDAQGLAYGGKLLGAGGGGYVLLICEDREETNFHMTAKGYRTIKPNIVNKWIIKQ